MIRRSARRPAARGLRACYVAAVQNREPPRIVPRHVVRVDLTLRTALIAVGTLAAVWLLIHLWQVLLVIVVALMLVGMLNPFVERLEARHVRRGIAIGVVYGVLSLIFVGLGALFVPQLVRQVGDLLANFPKTQESLARQLEASGAFASIAKSVRAMRLETLTEQLKDYGLAYGPKAAAITAYGITAFFLSLYLIIDRDRMRGGLFALVPRRFHVRLSRVLINLELIVGGYMRGQAITSALMAAFSLVVLLIAGVPNALALALFAGIVDVLPYVGALLACLPAFVAALPLGTTTAVVVLVALGVYQEFESRFVVPRIYGDVLRLPAASIMVALLVGGTLLGVLGALLALPIAAGIRMVVEELRVALPGEDVDDTELRAKDAKAEAEFEKRSAGVPATEAAMIATEIAEQRRAEDEAAAADPLEATEVPLTSGRPVP